MPDALESILRLVAEGRLSADEATTIIEAMASVRRATGEARRAAEQVHQAARGFRLGSSGGRQIRIRVSERGRDVMDLRVPFTVATLAGEILPGLPDSYRSRLRDALASGASGPILEVRDDQGEVRIVVE